MLNSAIDPSFQTEDESTKNTRAKEKRHKSKQKVQKTDEETEKTASEESQNLRNVGLDPEVTVAAIAAAAAANAHMNEKLEAKGEKSNSKNELSSGLPMDAQDRRSNGKAEDQYNDKFEVGANTTDLAMASRISPLLLSKNEFDKDRSGTLSQKTSDNKAGFINNGEFGSFSTNGGKMTANQALLSVKDRKPTMYNKPLKTSKRAAQNRTAQKAFRERRKRKMKDLEIIASQHEKCENTIEKLKQENCHLKEYVQVLESKLADIRVATLPNLDVISSKPVGKVVSPSSGAQTVKQDNREKNMKQKSR